MTQREFYENLFGQGLHVPWDDAPGKLVLLSWLSAISKSDVSSLVDVGCGSGYFTTACSTALGARVALGVDISYSAAALARDAYPSTGFLVGDACTLPFAAGCFDIVVSYGVFERVSGPSRALAEAGRLLKVGGLFAGMMPTIGHYRDDRSDAGWYEDLNDPPQMQWNLPRAAWESWFADSGISLEEVDVARDFGALRPGNFYLGFKSGNGGDFGHHERS